VEQGVSVAGLQGEQCCIVAIGIGEKGAALLCQRNLLLCPIEKPDTELLFQISNLPRE
jgi:hypothetical protein